MSERGKIGPKEALEILDNMDPSDSDWRDPDFVFWVSWLMMNFVYQRCGRFMEEAGYPVVVWPDS